MWLLYKYVKLLENIILIRSSNIRIDALGIVLVSVLKIAFNRYALINISLISYHIRNEVTIPRTKVITHTHTYKFICG